MTEDGGRERRRVVEADVVRTRHFELVDDEGNQRAQLIAGNKGSGSASLVLQTGGTNVILQARGDGVSLVELADSSGLPRARVVVYPDGRPQLELSDERGMPRLRIVLTDDGPQAWIASAEGSTTFKDL